MNEIYEILKEYKMYVAGLEFEIKGRVLQRVELSKERDFKWEISHYCKPHPDAVDVYIPGRESGQTFEEAKHLLTRYMKAFTNISVKINPFY